MGIPDVSFVWPGAGEIEDHLKKGVQVLLPPIKSDESPEDKQKRTIQSEWIAGLAAQPQREIKTPIVLRGVIVQGPLDLAYTTFFTDFSITGSEFDSEVDLSFANFHKIVSFERTEFRGKVILNGAKVQNDLKIPGAEFKGDLDAEELVVMNTLRAGGATFHQSVNFNGLKVEGQVEFDSARKNVTTFHGPASFLAAHIKGQAIFSGAQFFGTAKFDLTQIDGSAFFDVERGSCGCCGQSTAIPVLFKGRAQFIGTVVGMQLVFEGAFFRSSADFDGLVVKGGAHFDKTRFEPHDRKVLIKTDFPGIRVTGETKFEDAVFDGDVRFQQGVFEREALFGGAKFLRKAIFDGVHFRGPAFFRTRGDKPRSAKFTGEACFIGVVADRDVDFRGCIFDETLSLQDARFNTVHFREKVTRTIPSSESRQFPKHMGKLCACQPHIDLRGFSYDRIYVAWEEIISLLEPFDKQPYRLMEAVFRTMGKERDANKVYLRQKLRSWAYYCKRPITWPRAFSDFFYWLFFNFGVRPIRLLVITGAMLIVSGWYFSQPGAVKAKNGVPYYQLTYAEGLGASFNFFMPFDVPGGGDWQPTDELCHFLGWAVRYSSLATFLRLAGWAFVPLGAAAFARLLRQTAARSDEYTSSRDRTQGML